MFLLFMFDDYYPSGGWNDFTSQHETLAEAQDAYAVRKSWGSRGHIVDMSTREIVWFD